jgi:hypothetical protein
MLTEKAGKQEAKDDDDEREGEQHDSADAIRGKTTASHLMPRWDLQATERGGGCQVVDEYTPMNNNSAMKRATPVRLIATALNPVCSQGATG